MKLYEKNDDDPSENLTYENNYGPIFVFQFVDSIQQGPRIRESEGKTASHSVFLIRL